MAKDTVKTASSKPEDAFPGDDAINALATRKEGGTDVTVFAGFEEDSGSDVYDMADVSIPFITVLQALSPQINKQDPAYIEGAESGMILNTATGQLYDGERGVMVCVVTHQRRYTEWWPRNSKKGKGIVADHGTDQAFAVGKVLDTKAWPWRTKDDTVIIEAGVFYVILVDENGAGARGVVNLQGTQFKKYKALNTMMSSWMLRGSRGSFNPPSFARLYRMTSVPERNDQGNWFGVKFTPGPALGPTGDEYLDAHLVPDGGQIYALAKAFRQQVQGGEITVAAPMSDVEAAAGEKVQEDGDNDQAF